MPGARQTQPQRADSSEAAVALAHGTCHVPRRVEVVALEIDVERDQRRACSDQHAAGPLVELCRAEVRLQLPGGQTPLQLGRAAAAEEGGAAARCQVRVEEDRQRKLLPHAPPELECRGARAVRVSLPDRDERDDVRGADERVRAFVTAQVDPLTRARDPGE